MHKGAGDNKNKMITSKNPLNKNNHRENNSINMIVYQEAGQENNKAYH